MASEFPRKVLELAYHEWAQRYLRSFRMGDFMEATSQATQRKITLESLDVVRVHRPDIQTFNELLIQSPHKGRRRPVQVVADNMVVVWDQPIVAEVSFDVPLQPVGPFWVMEYVSKNTKRKDYEVSLLKYEQDLKVLYFSMFTPDDRELALYRHNGEKYVSVQPSEQGRYALPELELEIGLFDDWMRFWFRGELVPLTPDLQRGLEKALHRAEAAERRAETAEHRAEQLEEELKRLRAQLAQPKHDPPESS